MFLSMCPTSVGTERGRRDARARGADLTGLDDGAALHPNARVLLEQPEQEDVRRARVLQGLVSEICGTVESPHDDDVSASVY